MKHLIALVLTSMLALSACTGLPGKNTQIDPYPQPPAPGVG